MSGPRLRFAPSPTGYLHVGGARTVLFNWLYARQHGGEMVLRIEDTDTERNRPELTDNILEMIEWLGLGWDGEPVHQSDHIAEHGAAADRLLAAGRAYWCDCTPEQVDEAGLHRCRIELAADGEGSSFVHRRQLPTGSRTEADR